MSTHIWLCGRFCSLAAPGDRAASSVSAVLTGIPVHDSGTEHQFPAPPVNLLQLSFSLLDAVGIGWAHKIEVSRVDWGGQIGAGGCSWGLLLLGIPAAAAPDSLDGTGSFSGAAFPHIRPMSVPVTVEYD